MRQHSRRNKLVWFPFHLLGLCAPGTLLRSYHRGGMES